MFCDLETCLSRNYHKRDRKQIERIITTWNPTPFHYIKLDVGALLDNVVDMQDAEDIVLVRELTNSLEILVKYHTLKCFLNCRKRRIGRRSVWKLVPVNALKQLNILREHKSHLRKCVLHHQCHQSHQSHHIISK